MRARIFYALCNSMLETIKYNLIQTINHKTKLIPRWGNDALFGIDKDFRNKLFFTAQKKYMHFPPAEIKRYAIELVIEEMGRLHYAWQKSFSIDSGSHMDYMNKINPLE